MQDETEQEDSFERFLDEQIRRRFGERIARCHISMRVQLAVESVLRKSDALAELRALIGVNGLMSR